MTRSNSSFFIFLEGSSHCSPMNKSILYPWIFPKIYKLFFPFLFLNYSNGNRYCVLSKNKVAQIRIRTVRLKWETTRRKDFFAGEKRSGATVWKFRCEGILTRSWRDARKQQRIIITVVVIVAVRDRAMAEIFDHAIASYVHQRACEALNSPTMIR